MNYLFYLKNTANVNKEFPVYLRIFDNRKSKYISLNISTKKKNWNNKSKTVKYNDLDYKRKNSIIKAYKNICDSLMLEDIINHHVISIDEFVNKIKSKDKTDFYEYALSVINNKTNITDSTKNEYVFRLNSVIKIIGENISIKQFTDHYINSIIAEYSKSHTQTSAYNILSLLSMILNSAVKDELINYNYCKDIKIKFDTKEKDFLTAKEINILEKLAETNVLKKRVLRTLKLFLFSCYTGISYSDLKTFTRDDIKIIEVNKLEYKMIISRRKKTKTTYRIPLTAKAEQIINELDSKFNTYFLSTEHTATNSQHMKKIRKAVPEIKKHITFHTARHTFGTYWASRGVSEKILMEMMGHTQAGTNRIYSKIQDFTLIETILKQP
jgi:integrase